MSKHLGQFGALGALAGMLLVAGCSTPQTQVQDFRVSGGSAGATMTAEDAQSSQTMQADHGQVNALDRLFVKKASGANLEEVALGEMGLQKAQTASVKEFAQMMVTDHSKSQQELETAASEAGLEPPTELPPEAKATMERLSKLSGMEFDRAFMQVMVVGHVKAVQLFTQESQKGEHPSLVGYAQKTLPTLEMHLTKAREINAQLK